MDAPHTHLLVGESTVPPFLAEPSSAVRTPLLALLVTVVSYLAARLGATIVLSSQGLSVLWPPCTLLVAAMLLVPRRNWLVLIPAGLAGSAVENLQLGFTPGVTGPNGRLRRSAHRSRAQYSEYARNPLRMV